MIIESKRRMLAHGFKVPTQLDFLFRAKAMCLSGWVFLVPESPPIRNLTTFDFYARIRQNGSRV